MIHWYCSIGHRVRAPGQMGRSWCIECEDYIIPVNFETEDNDNL